MFMLSSLEISRREPGAICISKIAPGSWGFGRNQGQFEMKKEQFSKFNSMLPEHNKVRAQRDRISLVFIVKTSKITSEGKFISNFEKMFGIQDDKFLTFFFFVY